MAAKTQVWGDIIKSALRKIGAASIYESPSSEQIAHGEIALQNLISSIGAAGYDTHTLSSSTFDVTTETVAIGPGQTVNVTVIPTKINSASITSTKKLLRVLDPQDYAEFRNTTANVTGTPDVCTLLPAMVSVASLISPAANGGRENGTLYFWPVPESPVEVRLDYTASIDHVSIDKDAYVTVPKDYVRMITYQLALELAPEYGKQVSQEVYKTAEETKTAYQRRNQPAPVLYQMPMKYFDVRGDDI